MARKIKIENQEYDQTLEETTPDEGGVSKKRPRPTANDLPKIKDLSASAKFTKAKRLPTLDEIRVIRNGVRSYHDIQKLRIATGNRLAANFRVKLGLASSAAEVSDSEAKKTLDVVRKEYKRITDGIIRITRSFTSDSTVITSYAELSLIESYEQLLTAEGNAKSALDEYVTGFPIYTEYLSKIRGVGSVLSAVLIAEYDIVKTSTVSKMWAHAGLDVVVNENGEGEGRSKRKNHLVPRTYTNRDGETVETVGITFRPLLKSVVVEIAASVFIKLGNQYTHLYYDYKHRLEHHAKYKDVSKGHRDRMAKRYMMKIFLQDLYPVWRTMYDLDVTLPYHEAKLGMVHHEKGSAAHTGGAV
jgi:hypothetical protein